MSFASYTSTRTSETSGEIGSSHDSEDFADGFKEWLVHRVEGWARENPEEAQRVERVIGQAQSVFLGAIREGAPLLEVFAADGLAAALKKQCEERAVAITHVQAVRLAFGLMTFRLPYTGENRGQDGDIATIRDYELMAVGALMDDSLPALIDDSRSNPVAFRALQSAIEHLRRRQEPLPSMLSEWALDVAGGKQACPKARPGRSRYANRVRDALIVRTVRTLVDCGLRPTRNEASGPQSACDAVSEALKAHGVELSYEAVAKVWGKRAIR